MLPIEKAGKYVSSFIKMLVLFSKIFFGDIVGEIVLKPVDNLLVNVADIDEDAILEYFRVVKIEDVVDGTNNHSVGMLGIDNGCFVGSKLVCTRGVRDGVNVDIFSCLSCMTLVEQDLDELYVSAIEPSKSNRI